MRILGADGDSVTNVRFPKGWDTRSRSSSYVAIRSTMFPA